MHTRCISVAKLNKTLLSIATEAELIYSVLKILTRWDLKSVIFITTIPMAYPEWIFNYYFRRKVFDLLNCHASGLLYVYLLLRKWGLQSNILLRFKTQKVSRKNVVKPRICIDCLKICPVISLTCPRISVTTCRLRSGQTRTFSFLRNLFLAPPQRMYELLTEIVGTATLAAFWLIFCVDQKFMSLIGLRKIRG